MPLTALLHAAQALAGTLDPGRVEQMIVDEAVAALRADAAVLLGQAEVPGEYRVRAQCGLAATYGARVRVAASDAAGLAASTQVF
ncbi:MAG: hypothetical protein QME94_17670, partial [Anaerolineae bacterium]|nr:hypothetical protein [Anaerolineae bacterium]